MIRVWKRPLSLCPAPCRLSTRPAGRVRAAAGGRGGRAGPAALAPAAAAARAVRAVPARPRGAATLQVSAAAPLCCYFATWSVAVPAACYEQVGPQHVPPTAPSYQQTRPPLPSPVFLPSFTRRRYAGYPLLLQAIALPEEGDEGSQPPARQHFLSSGAAPQLQARNDSLAEPALCRLSPRLHLQTCQAAGQVCPGSAHG